MRELFNESELKILEKVMSYYLLEGLFKETERIDCLNVFNKLNQINKKEVLKN